ARRVGASLAIVRVRVCVSGIIAARRADRAVGQRVVGGVEADFRAGGAVQIGHELDRGAFDQGADGQLNRLQAAGPGGNVEDVAVQEVEHAGRHFAADDLLLIGDDIHDFEGGGLHQTQVDRDVHHEHLAGDQARAAVLFHFAAGDVEAARADVVVHLGDAADHIEVRARHLTGQD